MADIYRAKEAFAYTDKQGVPRVVPAGHLMSSDNPDLKGKEHLFEPVEVAATRQSGVEEATAEPGKLRSVSTAKPKDESTEPVKPVYGATHPPGAVKRSPGRPRKV